MTKPSVAHEINYRESHALPGYGKRYRKTYEFGYYAAQWKLIEEPILQSIVRGLKLDQAQCLDFACGTGRIAASVAGFCQHVTGVDVSAEMLKAAVVPGNVELVEHDLTKNHLGKKFDLVTAFRFFLNAEEDLKVSALSAIRSHLKIGAPLIANIHMASSSPMGWVYRGMRKMGMHSAHNVMDKEHFIRLLEQNGFTIKTVVHYSFLPRPGRYFPRFCEKVILPLEKFCQFIRIPKNLAQSFLIIAILES